MDNQKQNDESKSSGMELLENVIKSNERNIASNNENMKSNAEMKSEIESFLYLMGETQQDLTVVNQSYKNTLDFYEKEQILRDQYIASIPTKVELVFSQETSDYLENFKKTAKRMAKFTWSGIGTFILGILTFILSINFATNWYKVSIKAKSELRQDILNEIASEGKKIYDESEIKILKENTKVMQIWIKNNPKKAEDFLQFKDGFEAKKKE
ncbi:hypothetical protein [Chryseobacterium taichungense]|uniref:hypothetical protein n=1 Tax=Chryseobacterium taichungense TaxID=295069 RepID=UPI0028A937B3|nr:hypothetical protein [Chryseobacterium taichungense]